MNTLTKIATTGALALSLTASGMTIAPASANDNGAGLAIGLATGLIVGGILLNGHRHHHQPQVQFYGDANYDNGPSCYLGPQRSRWEQVCQQDAYGDTYCQNVKHYYRQQICN